MPCLCNMVPLRVLSDQKAIVVIKKIIPDAGI